MRFLVAWDGSELSTLALQATIRIFSKAGDQLLVYHVANRGRYGASEEFGVEALQARLASELEAAEGKLVVLTQRKDGHIEEVEHPDAAAGASPTGPQQQSLLTVHEKEAAEARKISQRIVEFADVCAADALVMGSMGLKQESSSSYRRTTLGSSAHVAALSAPCTVLLIRPGCKLDARLSTVFMVAVDGSQHALHALRLAADLARPKRDEVVCRVYGPPSFTELVEEKCTSLLQETMRDKNVEYAVIPELLEDSADCVGDELAEAAKECRFRQQAFLVFGARGRCADGTMPGSPSISPECSPKAGRGGGAPAAATSLGHVARWCIREAQCSLIVARPSGPPPPGVLQYHVTR